MPSYKSLIVRVGGKTPEYINEMEPVELNKLLDNGYQIKEVHQIATNPAAGGSGSVILGVGVVILTYVLFKP
jgi:hypothetical protein